MTKTRAEEIAAEAAIAVARMVDRRLTEEGNRLREINERLLREYDEKEKSGSCPN